MASCLASASLRPLHRVRRWAYRWLPAFFGCHCRPERSFFYRGVQFPICARCTGELAGILLAVFTWAAAHPGGAAAGLLLVPLIADGLLQLRTAYESNNLRRLWTGILFGYGLTDLFLLSVEWTLRWGYRVGLALQGA